MTEFGAFDLFRFDSFIVHFRFALFPSPRYGNVHDKAFSGKGQEHRSHIFEYKEGAFPMTGNMYQNNDFYKGRLMLELPEERHEAFAKTAGNRDDGARPIERDGRSRYRAKPSTGNFHYLFGKVEYQRSLYRNGTWGKSICPADESPGRMARNRYSPCSMTTGPSFP